MHAVQKFDVQRHRRAGRSTGLAARKGNIVIHEPVAVSAHALEAELMVPDGAHGLVMVFTDDSGGSRNNTRNQMIAQSLQRRRLGTLLLDLLMPSEAAQQDKAHDVELLTRRVLEALDWRAGRPELHDLPLGLLGAGVGAAAALLACAERPQDVDAMVSRSGRTDLAGEALGRVLAPTLLIVGGADVEVRVMNLDAYRLLAASEKQLEVVPRATHLFREAGALETVAGLAGQWFVKHLAAHKS